MQAFKCFTAQTKSRIYFDAVSGRGHHKEKRIKCKGHQSFEIDQTGPVPPVFLLLLLLAQK